MILIFHDEVSCSENDRSLVHLNTNQTSVELYSVFLTDLRKKEGLGNVLRYQLIIEFLP